MPGIVLFLILSLACWGCQGSEFWNYVVDSPIEPNNEGGGNESAEQARNAVPMFTPYNMKVVFNNGSEMTEVYIPVLTANQKVYIDNKKSAAIKPLDAIPPTPGEADRELEKDYLKSGKRLIEDANRVSISKTHERIRLLVQEGNYGTALEYAQNLLNRYPQHVKTLQAKGSILLQMGELESSLGAYEKAQGLEFDNRVAEQIKNIEKRLNEEPKQ